MTEDRIIIETKRKAFAAVKKVIRGLERNELEEFAATQSTILTLLVCSMIPSNDKMILESIVTHLVMLDGTLTEEDMKSYSILSKKVAEKISDVFEKSKREN